FGDIVIFGRDDTSKHKSVGGVLSGLGPLGKAAGGFAGLKKDEKAVVQINLRIVDAETGEGLETSEGRGESSRPRKDYAVLLGARSGGTGAAGGGSSGMNAANFQETIIGEATSNAVDKVVAFLEGKVPQMPAKVRSIEGQVATVAANGVYLNVGANE